MGTNELYRMSKCSSSGSCVKSAPTCFTVNVLLVAKLTVRNCFNTVSALHSCGVSTSEH
jgi:hypothetical protein